ncbi:unnamed protein product [Zymoseptoria tritici ST99CH_3D1]|uniref:Uncharacterized protein n=1 Tax=Zymoseptoria tritici ST99CH_1E4 TaxID=1276532 RepID=A0A2H1GTV0_ZYMTR|nr:unnamed protein product [Zymoseptoria tritici ST99CH_1E4]SMR59829.1 unnamed protein product [Zymoseptoria tritici ST99CH_3D1]
MSEGNANVQNTTPEFTIWQRLNAHMAALRNAEGRLSDAATLVNNAEARLDAIDSARSSRRVEVASSGPSPAASSSSNSSSDSERVPPAYTAGDFVQLPPPAYTPDPLGRFDHVEDIPSTDAERSARIGAVATVREALRNMGDAYRRDIEAAAPRRTRTTTTTRQTTTTAVVRVTPPRARLWGKPQQVLWFVIVLCAFLPSIVWAKYSYW